MINKDNEQIVVNRVKIERILEDLKVLRDLLIEQALDNRTTNKKYSDKLLELDFEVKYLRDRLNTISALTVKTDAEVSNITSLKTKVIGWGAGASFIIFLIWEYFKNAG